MKSLLKCGWADVEHVKCGKSVQILASLHYRYTGRCCTPVTHAQTWDDLFSYSVVYWLCSLSQILFVDVMDMVTVRLRVRLRVKPRVSIRSKWTSAFYTFNIHIRKSALYLWGIRDWNPLKSDFYYRDHNSQGTDHGSQIMKLTFPYVLSKCLMSIHTASRMSNFVGLALGFRVRVSRVRLRVIVS